VPFFHVSDFAVKNVAAGAADASRAMLRTSCPRVAPLAAIFAFLGFLEARQNQ
jgi:hypothetical protein